ncbi:MAG: response regulator transcription factor [Bacteroidetes bacterium]|nr:MAG: response regulator transcription factor [Bacteroidota bacterium]
MSSSYSPIRLVIADDHEIFREGLESLFNKQKEIELAGEAINGKQLLEQAERLLPDVILTDIKMPVIDGIEATKILTEKFPQIGIIALSMFEDENLIVEMLEAGAKGYLMKNAHKHEIIAAINAVYNQESYFCNHTTMKLAKLIGKSRFNPFKEPIKPGFTEKEREMIKLICQEFSNKEIATTLHQSPRTIEGYREKILEKTKAKNTAGIVIYAIKNGIYKI